MPASASARSRCRGCRPGRSRCRPGLAPPLPTLSGADIALTRRSPDDDDRRPAHAMRSASTAPLPAPLIRLREGQTVRLTVDQRARRGHARSTGTACWCRSRWTACRAISFPGITPRHDLHLRVPDPAGGHLLVSQPFRAAGAAGPLRPDRDRSRRRRSGRGRTASMSSCCPTTARCTRTRSSAKLKQQARLFQLPEADAGRAARRPGPAAEGSARLGRACGWTRPTSSDVTGADLHLSRQRPWPARTTGPRCSRPGERVRLRIINASAMTDLQRPHPRPDADDRAGRRAERAAGRRSTSSRSASPRPMT